MAENCMGYIKYHILTFPSAVLSSRKYLQLEKNIYIWKNKTFHI